MQSVNFFVSGEFCRIFFSLFVPFQIMQSAFVYLFALLLFFSLIFTLNFIPTSEREIPLPCHFTLYNSALSCWPSLYRQEGYNTPLCLYAYFILINDLNLLFTLFFQFKNAQHPCAVPRSIEYSSNSLFSFLRSFF